jgi:hypothetical protein
MSSRMVSDSSANGFLLFPEKKQKALVLRLNIRRMSFFSFAEDHPPPVICEADPGGLGTDPKKRSNNPRQAASLKVET